MSRISLLVLTCLAASGCGVGELDMPLSAWCFLQQLCILRRSGWSRDTASEVNDRF